MFDHVEIKVVHFDECLTFYTAVLQALGIEVKWVDEAGAGFGLISEPNVRFLIEKGETSTKNHLAFKAANEAEVKTFHSAGITLGAPCNGKPGLRESYAPNYYAAFLLDPDGNNIEALVYL